MKRRLQGLFLCLLLGLLLQMTEVRFYVAAATTVEGDIVEDATWVAAKSPYLITDDIKVHEGVTLTIDPGVVVRFNGNSSLIVAGSLLAVGTADGRIVFTSSQSDPAAGHWSGLKFDGGETESFILEFVDVKYAVNGIVLGGPGRAVVKKSEITSNSLNGICVIGQSNVLIEENVIKLNGNGLSAAGETLSGIKAGGNSISSNDENGIYLHSTGGQICRIQNVTILDNEIFQNQYGMSFVSHGVDEGRIYNVTISGNSVSSNKYGISLKTQGWYGGYIYDLVIFNNTVAFNEEGIDLYSGSEWYRWIADVTISRNRVFSNKNGISLDGFRICAPYDPFAYLPFDATFVGNIISANDDKGVTVLGDVRANFTDNSISHNSYGIYITTNGNHAVNNDIYQNSLYGMYVKNVHVAVTAQVMAEYNYWGASNGPYHEELNPDGMGDHVYGGEENIDFKPFLTEPFGVINEAPVAVLKVNKTTVAVNQTVMVDGSESSDDASIIEYFFDFGDGETLQSSDAVAGHEYASVGNYSVSLVVMDDLGVKSTHMAIQPVTVTLPLSLVVSVSLSPLSVVSGEEVLVEVHVSDGLIGIKEAFVQLASDEGGDFEPASGYTDSNGDFSSTFSAPCVSEPTPLRIVATASKEGCENCSADVTLSVSTPPPSGIESVPLWVLFVITVITGALVVIMLLRRTRKPTDHEEKDSHAISPRDVSTPVPNHMSSAGLKMHRSACQKSRQHL